MISSSNMAINSPLYLPFISAYFDMNVLRLVLYFSEAFKASFHNLYFQIFLNIWLCSSRYSNPTSYFSNHDLNSFSYMSTFDEYHAALYPSNTISAVANLCNVYFIFLAYLELYCISRIHTEARFTNTTAITYIISAACALVK